MEKLYENIKRLRKQMGMSQDELAQKTGYTDRSSISKIEAGEVDLQQSKIALFAKALRTTSAELVGWTDYGLDILADLDAAIDQQYGADVTDHVHKYVSLDMEDRSRIDERTETLLEGEKYSAKEGFSVGAGA